MLDWAHFTPWTSLAGGVVLGLAVAAFIVLSGRVLGISGIVAGLLTPARGDTAWRLAFMLGMAVSPWVYNAWAPAAWVHNPHVDASTGTLIVAGLLVGVGTQYGSGCTSGHGVCGLSRLSARSLLATLTFMGLGFATVYLMRHLLQGGAA